MNPLETAGVFILVTLGVAFVIFAFVGLLTAFVGSLRDEEWVEASMLGSFLLFLLGLMLFLVGYALK